MGGTRQLFVRIDRRARLLGCSNNRERLLPLCIELVVVVVTVVCVCVLLDRSRIRHTHTHDVYLQLD